MKDNKEKKVSGVDVDGRGVAVLERKKRIPTFLSGVEGKKLLNALLCFVLALVVSGAGVLGGIYPFGLAMTAGVSGIANTVAATLGVVIGSVGIGDGGGIYAVAAIALAAARLCTSIWMRQSDGDEKKRGRFFTRAKKLIGASPTPRRAVEELTLELKNYSGIMLRENYKLRLALSASAALFAGAWSVVEGGYDYNDLIGAVFGLLITPIVVYIFYSAMNRHMTNAYLREVGVYFVLAVVSLSLHGLSTGGLSSLPSDIANNPTFNLGIGFAFAAACLISMDCGIHRGALAGILCGVVMAPLYAPAYALCAVVCGVLVRYSQPFALLSAIVTATAWGIYAGGLEGFAAVFPPTVAAGALMIPLCKYKLLKIPTGMFEKGAFARHDAEANISAIEVRDVYRRINSLADGLESVSAVLGGLAQRLKKPAVSELREIVECAFGDYCGSCKNSEKCAGGNMSKISALIPKMVSELYENGVVGAGVVPPSLASVCYNMGSILDEINLNAGKRIASMREGDKLAVSAADYGLAGELFRTAVSMNGETSSVDKRLSQKLRRALVADGFAASSVTAYGNRMKHIFVGDVDISATRLGGDDIRRLFEEIVGSQLSSPEFELDGEGLSMKLHTVCSYKCKSGTYSVAASSVQRYYGERRGSGANCSDELLLAEGEAEAGRPDIDVTDREPEGVCGDAVTTFEADGRYYMIISDGMGSGKEAALTSGVVISLLERLICSGADMECALKMLNRIIRSAELECSASVDIAEIDLVTGEARFVKSGAAPSFVLRDGSIFRLQSKTVPIGIIRALDAEMIKFDVQEGDTIVMLSDGVARSYDEAPWLLDLMVSDENVLSGNEKYAAMTIVGEAAIRGARDDITAGIVRVLGS